MSNGRPYEPELGQVLHGQPWQRYDLPEWVEQLLWRIDDALEAASERDGKGYWSPFLNTGNRFQNDVFAVEAYSWTTKFHATLSSGVRGIHALGNSGPFDRIYVAQRRSVVQLDGATGQQVSAFAALTPRLTGLGFQYPPPSGGSYSCAC